MLRRLSVVRRRAAQRALAAPVVVACPGSARWSRRGLSAAIDAGLGAASQGGGPAAVWRRLGRRLSAAPQRLHAVGARRPARSGAGCGRPAPPGAAQPHRGRAAGRPAARRLRSRRRARDVALHAQPAAARRRLGGHGARRWRSACPTSIRSSSPPCRRATCWRASTPRRRWPTCRVPPLPAASPRPAQDRLRDAGRPLAARGRRRRRPGARWISPLPRAAGRCASGRTAGRRRRWPDAR